MVAEESLVVRSKSSDSVIIKMSNYLASHSDREKNSDDMHDEQDLLELIGKALKSRYNAHNFTIPLSKF